MNLPDDFVATPEFDQCLRTVIHGAVPLFVTGNAGTGKSTFLQYMLENLDEDENPVVLAPTGVAAVNVGGSTIHSFFKFPPRYVNLDSITANYKWQREFRSTLSMLIIDEISMVRADMMDNIDVFLRLNMGVDAPFGGVRLVMIGDLHQLPPVVEDSLKQYFKNVYTSPYFFHAKVFEDVSPATFELTHIFRQKDPTFIRVLNNVRRGQLSNSDANVLNTRVNRSLEGNAIMLTTTNKLADNLNTIKLASLSATPKTYTAEINGDFPMKYFPTTENLVLKVGAQVMMLRNGPGYCNGTICEVSELKENTVVVKWEDDTGMTRIREIEPVSFERIEYESLESRIHGKAVGTFKQLPLKLAWAITMHKSQGMTFDKVKIDFGFGSFAHGQTYVALSRCRSLEGLSLKRRIAQRDILFDNAVLKMMH